MKFLENRGFSEGKPKHYYGDIVRIMFLVAAIIMLVGLPYFQDKTLLPTTFSMAAILILIFLAGLTNPRQIWLSFIDTTVSLLGLAIFEYIAVTNFENFSDSFFLANQTLAIVFLIAFYYSTKTLRGFYLKK